MSDRRSRRSLCPPGEAWSAFPQGLSKKCVPRATRARGAVRQKTANNSDAVTCAAARTSLCGYRNVEDEVQLSVVRALGEKRRGKRLLRILAEQRQSGTGGPPHRVLDFLIPIPPVASSFSACRRALRRKRPGIWLQNGGPIAVGYGSAGDCRHTFARNQDAGQIKWIGSG